MISSSVLDQGLILPNFLDTTAIIVGALTGAMHATRKGLDVLGVLMIAFATGVGGGLVRDLLLQNGEPALLLHPWADRELPWPAPLPAHTAASEPDSRPVLRKQSSSTDDL